MAEASLMLGGAIEVATPSEVRDIVRDELVPFRRRDPRPLYSDAVSGAQASANGVITTLDVDGPGAGSVWDIRQLVLAGLDDSNALNALTASAAGAGAAGGNAALPAGAAITGFDLSFATAAAPVSGVVTVTNAVGGTLSYQVTDGVNGGSLSIRYPTMLSAVSAATAITVTVPAIPGGSAWTLTVYGSVQAAWYKAMSSVTGIPTLLIPRGGIQGVVPSSVVPASAKSLWLHFGERLVANVYGLSVNQQVTGIVRYAEWPDTTPETRRI